MNNLLRARIENKTNVEFEADGPFADYAESNSHSGDEFTIPLCERELIRACTHTES